MSTSLTPNYLAPYNPSIAEDGKFVPVSTSTISGYPTSGFGKYAVLVKSVDTPITLTNTTWIGSTSISPGSNVFYPPAALIVLDIYNNSSNTIFVYPGVTTGATASTDGMPVISSSRYTINSTLTAFTISPTVVSSNIRIIGYY